MIKNKFKIEYILLALLVVGLVLIFGSFLRQLNFPDTSYNLEKGERIEIIPGNILQQKFIANENGLSNLKILLGGKSLKKDYSLNLILADENCIKGLHKKTINGPRKFDSKYLYEFKFDRVNNSKDKKYCLIIKYDTIAENPKKREVRLFENSLSKKHSKYIIKSGEGDSETQGAGAIVFRESYRSDTLRQDFQQLNQRISQYKPWFLKGWWLVIIILLATILTACTVWGIMVAKKQGVRDEL